MKQGEKNERKGKVKRKKNKENEARKKENKGETSYFGAFYKKKKILMEFQGKPW
jgi:hypothetical protein